MERYNVKKSVLGEITLSLFEQVQDILFPDVGVERKGRQIMDIMAKEWGALRKWCIVFSSWKVRYMGWGWRTRSV